MGKVYFTCIVPFYNESKNILRVLSVVDSIPTINQVILIDDGSTNDIYKSVAKKFKKIKLIKLAKNHGKATAVKTGLKYVKNENIVMLDADLRNLNKKELENVLLQYTKSKVDMLLMQIRGGNTWLDQALRKEILFTGFRVLKTADLNKAYRLSPKRYQLEVAINQYMLDNDKKVAWMQTKVKNLHKLEKWGIVTGIIESNKMELSILFYLGIVKFLRQSFTFAKQKYE